MHVVMDHGPHLVLRTPLCPRHSHCTTTLLLWHFGPLLWPTTSSTTSTTTLFGTCLARRDTFDLQIYLEVILLVFEGYKPCLQLALALSAVLLGRCADREGALPKLAREPDPMATSSTSSSGIPLDEYRRDVPPGWEPGQPRYSVSQTIPGENQDVVQAL